MRVFSLIVAALALSSGVLAQPASASPAAAGAAGSSGGGGAVPVAPASPGPAKKALLAASLRDLTNFLGARPAAGGPGKLSGVVGTLLSVVLDNNFNGLISQPQGIFDFGNSGAASLYWPQGNLPQVQRYGELLKNVTTTGDLAAIAPAVGGALNELCAPERFVPQQLLPAGCKGPEIELRMHGAECLVDVKTSEVVCRPSFLELINSPASCTLPSMSPAQWEGRSCAAYSFIGPKVDYAVGYAPFNVSIPSPQPIANALLAPLRGAGARLLEKVGAKMARTIGGGIVGSGGATTSTTAAVGGGNNGQQQQG